MFFSSSASYFCKQGEKIKKENKVSYMLDPIMNRLYKFQDSGSFEAQLQPLPTPRECAHPTSPHRALPRGCLAWAISQIRGGSQGPPSLITSYPWGTFNLENQPLAQRLGEVPEVPLPSALV